MASSYSGDPNLLHNNPFLDMLAAVEEQIEDDENQQQQQQQRNSVFSSGGRVKLPEFWAHSPGIWFARAELRFMVAGVTSEMEKFAYTADALPYESLRMVTDLVSSPPQLLPYSALKERLLIAHQLTPLQKAQKVNDMPALGDRRPSQMLAALLEFCPEGEENTSFFRAAFVHRLPREIQVLLDGMETADLKTLAQRADRLWVTRAVHGDRVAAMTTAEASGSEEETSCVAAIRPPAQKNKSFPKRPGNNTRVTDGASGQQKPDGWNGHQGGRRPKLLTVCRAHMRYGAEAYRCQDPTNCMWSGN